MPGGRIKVARDFGRGPGNRGLGAPGIELAGGETVSAVTQANGTPAAMARSIIASAKAGLVAKPVSGGTCAPTIRAGSLVHAWGRYSARSIKPCPCRET